MGVRTTVDLPESLHAELKRHAKKSRTSIRSLIVKAIEQTYSPPKRGRYITGPLLTKKGKRGPRFPVDETPHDLVFY